MEKMYEYDKKNDRFPKRFFSLEELHSWIWCLHKEICSSHSNVENRTLVYRGIRNVILQDSFRVGMTFCFAEFLSTSTDINTSIRFLKDSKIKENYSKIIFYIKFITSLRDIIPEGLLINL
jgi:hypothetical protein